jgi:hypothetical protein
MENIKAQFAKYLKQLQSEIASYKTEEGMWNLADGTGNAPATLALHLCGNLQHNIGAVMGKSGYVRNRDYEFSQRNTSREKILEEISNTEKMIIPVLEKLSAEDLNKEFEDRHHDVVESNGDALVRLALHMGYHVGQINYHRRVLGL